MNRNLEIPINGKLNQKTLFQALVGMSVNLLSINSIGNVVQKTPCETSFRHHLLKLDLPTLENVNSKILKSVSTPFLRNDKRYQFAINLINYPHSGEIDGTNSEYVIHSKQKKSTTSFYSYVSLYIIRKGERLTLAAFPVKKGIKMVEYVRKCVEIIQQLNVNV